ncbi:hypothetical protein HX037_10235 [Ignatzschineria indica]|uniref:hypothetical protein n=1 Tax=Ignatzschineria indica TaxID=472583 RepID=UPI002575E192|nr:hypothetical protein [Ignatzschineria indica]MDM1546240.1 hypothetical protein [Ignatzschineria indica]
MILQKKILKKIHGAAGADYFPLFTGACPRFDIFDAEDNIIKVTIIDDRRSPIAGVQFLEACDSEDRHLISLFSFDD